MNAVNAMVPQIMPAGPPRDARSQMNLFGENFDLLLYMSIMSNPENSKKLINENQDLYKQLVNYVETNKGNPLLPIKEKSLQNITIGKAYVRRLNERSTENRFSKQIGKEVAKQIGKAIRGEKHKKARKTARKVNERNEKPDDGLTEEERAFIEEED